MNKLEVLLEAERRGILPEDKKALLAEARRRGLVDGGEQPQAPAGTPALAALGAPQTDQIRQGIDNPILEQETAEMGTMGRFMAGVGRGMMAPVRGVQQMAARVGGDPEKIAEIDRTVKEEEAIFNKLREPGAAAMVGNIGGNIATLAPISAIPGAGSASLGARLASFGAQGALAGAAQPVTDTENFAREKALQTGVGAAAGIILPPAVKAIVNRGAKILSKLPKKTIFDAAGNLTDDGIAALEKEGIRLADLSDEAKASLFEQAKVAAKGGKALTPEQQLRKADFEALGISPTKGQLSRNFAQQQFEAEVAKNADAGVPIRNTFDFQNRALIEKLGSIQPEQPGAPITPFKTGQSVIDAVTSKFEQTGEKVSELYNIARQSKGIDAAVPKQKLFAKAAEVLDDFEDVIPSPIKNRLAQFGLNAEGKTSRELTLGEAEKFRKLINTRIKTADRAGAEGLRQLKQALDDSVGELAGGVDDASQAFQTARGAAATRFKEFEPPPLSSIVNKGIEPEDFVKRYVDNAKANQLSSLKRTLTTGTPEQKELGREAFSNIRGKVLADLIRKSTVISRTTSLDDPVFSAARFKKALDGIGNEKLSLLFTENERKLLGTISRVAQDRIPPAGAVNQSNTASALVNFFQRVAGGPRLSAANRFIREVVLEPGRSLRKTKVEKGVLEALDPEKSLTKENIQALLQARDATFRSLLAKLPLPEAGTVVSEQATKRIKKNGR